MFDVDNQFGLAATKTEVRSLRKTSYYASFGKRLFDVAFVVLVSPLIMPVIALFALIVRLDGSSAFFGHKRVGKDGRVFLCWKLRTMVPNAEDRLIEYFHVNPKAEAAWKTRFKLDNDPRITKLGRLLRKTSLDELPQFWNVLIGDMSVVGPRPVTLQETALYGTSATAIQSVRPGITGLWQVSGRNDISYDERVGLDLAYVNGIHLISDIRLIVRTVLVMVLRTGK